MGSIAANRTGRRGGDGSRRVWIIPVYPGFLPVYPGSGALARFGLVYPGYEALPGFGAVHQGSGMNARDKASKFFSHFVPACRYMVVKYENYV